MFRLTKAFLFLLILCGVAAYIGMRLKVQQLGRIEQQHFDEGLKQFSQQQSLAASRSAYPANTQFVLLSFDGSKSHDMWRQTLDFAASMSAQQKPMKFTYFVSGVYWLSPDLTQNYLPPSMYKRGESKIGFSDSVEQTIDRIGLVNRAYKEGHEIGSHANGHFNGHDWSQQDWKQELDQFSELVFHVPQPASMSAKMPQLDFSESNIRGFRAPELGVSPGLYAELGQRKFLYDASGVASQSAHAQKNAYGTWLIPLVSIPVAGTKTSALSMDYNFYVTQTRARDVLRKGTPKWNKMYAQTLDSFRAYFNQNYAGLRAPVLMGNHFSLWNDGLYWEVMKTFASEVCGKPQVVCGTFSEYANWRNAVSENPNSASN